MFWLGIALGMIAGFVVGALSNEKFMRSPVEENRR